MDGKQSPFLTEESKTNLSNRPITLVLDNEENKSSRPWNILPKGCNHILEEIGCNENETGSPNYHEILSVIAALPPPTKTKPIQLNPK